MTAFAELFAKRPDSAPGSIKPGLSRIRRAYDALQRPGSSTPTILVGGTNGKGSTAGQLWQMLTLAGHRPGLFSSPHLVHFSERYQIADTSVDDDRLIKEWHRLRARLTDELYDSLSFFEVATLLALELFHAEACTHFILEVGLGGRWDSTNIVDPDISIITSIGRDHEKFLGADLGGIAREKAGIMRRDRPVLWGGSEDAAVNEAIVASAREHGASLLTAGQDFPNACLKPEATGYQHTNLALAAGAACMLVTDQEWELVKAAWSGPKVQPFCMRGRCELWREAFAGRDVLVDVCHNPAGARAFVQAIADHPQQTVFVTVSSDKDHRAIAEELSHKFSCIVFFGTSAERSWRPNGDLPPGTFWADNLASAVAQYAEPGWPIVLCGSVLGVGALVADGVLKVSWG